MTVEVGGAGRTIGLLPHYIKHARCILIAVLGGAACCPDCAGTYRVVYDLDSGQAVPFDPEQHTVGESDSCWCDDGIILRPEVYQRFKAEVIGGLDADDWRLPAAGSATGWPPTRRPEHEKRRAGPAVPRGLRLPPRRRGLWPHRLHLRVDDSQHQRGCCSGRQHTRLTRPHQPEHKGVAAHHDRSH